MGRTRCVLTALYATCHLACHLRHVMLYVNSCKQGCRNCSLNTLRCSTDLVYYGAHASLYAHCRTLSLSESPAA